MHCLKKGPALQMNPKLLYTTTPTRLLGPLCSVSGDFLLLLIQVACLHV